MKTVTMSLQYDRTNQKSDFFKVNIHNTQERPMNIDVISNQNPIYKISVPSRITLNVGESIELSAHLPGFSRMSFNDLKAAWDIVSRGFSLGEYL